MVDTARYKNTDRDIQPVAITTVDPATRTATGISRSRTTIRINCAYATGDTITVPAVGEQWFCERFDGEWRLYGRIPFNDATLNIEPEEGQVSVGSASGPLELNGTEVRANAPVFRLNDAYFRDTGETLERSIDKINWEPIAAQAAGILQIVSNAIAGQPPSGPEIQLLLDALNEADLNAVEALSDFLAGWNTDGTRSLLSQLTKALTGNWGGLNDIATWAASLTSLWDSLCANNPFLNSLKTMGTGSTPAAQIVSGLQSFLNDLYKLLVCDFSGNATPQNFKDLLTGLQAVLSNNWLVKGLGDLANNPTGGLLANVFAGMENLKNNFFIEGLAAISSDYQAGVSNRLTAAVKGLEELFQNIFSALFCDVTGTLTVAQVKTRLNNFFDTLKPANNPLIQALKTYAEAQGNTLNSTLEKVVKGFSSFATTILDAVFCTGNTAINLSSVSSAVTSIFAAIRNSALVTGLVALFEATGDATLGVLEKAVRGLFSFYDQITAALSSLFPTSAPLAIVSAIQSMISAITNNPYIKMFRSVATTTSTNLIQQILSGVTGVLDWFIAIFKKLFPFIDWDKLRTLDFAGLMNDMVTFNINNLSQVGSWVTDGIVNPIKNAITGGIDATLGGSLKAINEFFGNINGGFLAKIVDAMTGNSLGFANGPLGTLANLFNGVSLTGGKSLLTQLGDRINDFGDTLGINSIVASITGANVGDLTNSFYLEIKGSPTGGNYTLSYGSNTTGSIAYNANAATIQTALALLTGIGAVTVTPVTSSTSTKFSVAIPNTTSYLTLGAFTLSGGTAPSITVTQKFRGALNALSSFFTNFNVFDGVNTLLQQVLQQAGSNIIPLVSALTGLSEAKLTELFGTSPIAAVTKIFDNLRSLFTVTPSGGTATMTLLPAGGTFGPTEIIAAANAFISNLLSKATAGIIPAAVIDNLSISKILVGADSLVKVLTGSATANIETAITELNYFFTNMRKFLGIGTGTGLTSFLLAPGSFSVPTAINNFITEIISQATATFSPARITGLITGLTGSGTAAAADIAKFFDNLRTTLGLSSTLLLPAGGTFDATAQGVAKRAMHDVVKTINDGLADTLKWAKQDVVNLKATFDSVGQALLGGTASYLNLDAVKTFFSTLNGQTGGDFLAKVLKYFTDQILGAGNTAITTLTNFFSGFNTTGSSVTGSLANQLAVKIGGSGATNLASLENFFGNVRKFLGLDALTSAGISLFGGTLTDANLLTFVNTFIDNVLTKTGSNLIKVLTGQTITDTIGTGLSTLQTFFNNLRSLFGSVNFLLPSGTGVGGFNVAANLQSIANNFINNVLSVATSGTIPAAVMSSLGVDKITGLVKALTGQETAVTADAITKFFSGFTTGAGAFDPATGDNSLVNQLSKSITGKVSGATLSDITNFLGIGTNNLAAFTGSNSLVYQIAQKIGGSAATSLASLGDFFTNVRKFFGLDLAGAPNFFATTGFNLATAVEHFITNVLKSTGVTTTLVTLASGANQIADGLIPNLDIGKITAGANSLVKALTGASSTGTTAQAELDRFFTNFRALFGGTNWLLQAAGTGGTAFNVANVANAFITNTLSQATTAITNLIPAHAFANFDVSKINNLVKALTGQDITGTLSAELTAIKNFFGGFTGFDGTANTLVQQITKAFTGKTAGVLDDISKFLGIGTANGGLLDFSGANTATLVNQIVGKITGTGTTLANLETFATNLKTFLGGTNFLAATSAFTAGLPNLLNTFAKTFIGGNTAKLLNSHLVGIVGTPNGGSFRLAYGDQITAAITWNATPATLASSVQSALIALTNIGTGGATATVNTTATTGSIVGIDVRIDNLIAPLTLSSNSLTVASGALPVVSVAQQTDPTFIPVLDVTKIGNLIKLVTGLDTNTAATLQNFFSGLNGTVTTATSLVGKIVSNITGGTGFNLVDLKAFSDNLVNFLGFNPFDTSSVITAFNAFIAKINATAVTTLLNPGKILGALGGATTLLTDLSNRPVLTELRTWLTTTNAAATEDIQKFFTNLRAVTGLGATSLTGSILSGTALGDAQKLLHGVISTANSQLTAATGQLATQIVADSKATIDTLVKALTGSTASFTDLTAVTTFATQLRTFLGFNPFTADLLNTTPAVALTNLTNAVNAFFGKLAGINIGNLTNFLPGNLLQSLDITKVSNLVNYITGQTGAAATAAAVQNFFSGLNGQPAVAASLASKLSESMTGKISSITPLDDIKNFLGLGAAGTGGVAAFTGANSLINQLVSQITGGTGTTLLNLKAFSDNLINFLGFNPFNTASVITAFNAFIAKINATAVTTFLNPAKIQSATAGIANLATEIVSKANIDGVVKAITGGTGTYTNLDRITNFFGGFTPYIDGSAATTFLSQLAKYITGNTYNTITAAISGLNNFFNRLRGNLNSLFNFDGLNSFFDRDPETAGPLKFTTSLLTDLDEWKKFTVVAPIVSQFLGGLKISREDLGLGPNEEPGLATLGDIAGRLLTDLTDIPANLLKGILPPNLLGVIPVSQISNTTPNLLSQGGFNDAIGIAPEAVADGWSWDTTQASSGHASAAKVTISSAKDRFLYSRQAVPVAKGDRLVVSAAFKTQTLTVSPAGSLPISIALIPFGTSADGNTVQLPTVTIGASRGSTTTWTTIGQDVGNYTVNDAAWKSVIVRLGIASTALTGGIVWWDDVSLRKVGELDQGNVNLLKNIWNSMIQGLIKDPTDSLYNQELTETQAQLDAVASRTDEFRSEFDIENDQGNTLRNVLFNQPTIPIPGANAVVKVPGSAIEAVTSSDAETDNFFGGERVDEAIARLDAVVGTLVDEKSVDTNPGRNIAVNFSTLPSTPNALPSTGSQTWSVSYLSGSGRLFGVNNGKATWNTTSGDRVAKVIYRGTGTRTLVVSGTGTYTLTVGTATTAAISSTAAASGVATSVQTLLTTALGTAGTGTTVTGTAATGYAITMPQGVLGVMSVTPGTGVTAIISDPLEKTLTDYQLMKGTLADPPTLSGNTASAFTAMARVSDDGSSYVYAKAYWAGLGNLRGEIGYAVNNVETAWQTNISLTWSTELSFRVGVGDDPRTYQVYSGTKKVTEYTEQLVGGVYLSKMGAANRRFGAIVRQSGGNSSGTISSVSVTDSGASTVNASIARMTRYDEQTFFSFPTANTALSNNFFEDELIKSDIIPDKVTGIFTVSKDGAYMVNARIKLSAAAEAVGTVNLQVRANDGTQAGVWVTAQRGIPERPFDAGYALGIGSPTTGFALCGNWVQYLTAGSAVRLSTQRNTGSSSILSGGAGGSETYFSIAKL